MPSRRAAAALLPPARSRAAWMRSRSKTSRSKPSSSTSRRGSGRAPERRRDVLLADLVRRRPGSARARGRSRARARSRASAGRASRSPGRRRRASRRGARARREEPLDERRDVLAPLAQRRHVDREDVEPVEEVLRGTRRPRTACGEVAVGGRDDAHVDLARLGGADRHELAAPGGTAAASPGSPAVISPISSRKSVPPSAAARWPAFRSVAPVKAPFSWPKSSLSSSVSGSAAQCTSTNGRRGAPARGSARSARPGSCRCRSRRGAARSRRSRRPAAPARAPRCIGRALRHEVGREPREQPLALALGLALRRRAGRTRRRSSSIANGLSQVVRGARLHRRDGALGGGVGGHQDHLGRLRQRARRARSTASPSTSGMRRSVSTTSNGAAREPRERLPAALHPRHLVAVELQRLGEELARAWARRPPPGRAPCLDSTRRGRRDLEGRPGPPPARSASVPPCRSTSRRDTASPSPVPPSWPVTNGSNRRPRASAGDARARRPHREPTSPSRDPPRISTGARARPAPRSRAGSRAPAGAGRHRPATGGSASRRRPHDEIAEAAPRSRGPPPPQLTEVDRASSAAPVGGELEEVLGEPAEPLHLAEDVVESARSARRARPARSRDSSTAARMIPSGLRISCARPRPPCATSASPRAARAAASRARRSERRLPRREHGERDGAERREHHADPERPAQAGRAPRRTPCPPRARAPPCPRPPGRIGK